MPPQGVADVTVTSAAALDEAQQKKLTAALEKRLKRKVRLHCEIDPGLIGGAVLRAGRPGHRRLAQHAPRAHRLRADRLNR